MSCFRTQKVLRMPAALIGINTEEEWKAYYSEHKKEMNWEPGTFAASLCSFKNGPMIDYILLDRAPAESGYNMSSRRLNDKEKEKYYPFFAKKYPGFTFEQMEDVHYCEYTWYDGTEAPYLY